MAKQKISNLAKELNVGLPNIFEFLRKNNIEIVESPNTRVEDTVVEMLTHHFQPDRELKTRSDQQTTDRQQQRAAARTAAPARAAEPEEAQTPSDIAQKPRILGKIELDAKGNPVRPAQSAEARKAEAEARQAAEEAARRAEEEARKAAEARKAEEEARQAAEREAARRAEEEARRLAEMQKKAEREAAEQSAAAEQTPQPEEPAATEPAKEPEIFTTGSAPRVQGPVILGKIDLSAINSNTRPKKKTKEERRVKPRPRQERAQQPATPAASATA